MTALALEEVGMAAGRRDELDLARYMDQAADKAAQRVETSITRQIDTMHRLGVERMAQYTSDLGEVRTEQRNQAKRLSKLEQVANIKRRFWTSPLLAAGASSAVTALLTWLLSRH